MNSEGQDNNTVKDLNMNIEEALQILQFKLFSSLNLLNELISVQNTLGYEKAKEA